MGKLEEAKNELEKFKSTSRENEKVIQQELKAEKDDRQKAEEELQ